MKGVYIVLSYPDKETFLEVINFISNYDGIDFIEIGYPFNDPVADGPVIMDAINQVYDKVTFEDLKEVLRIINKRKKVYVMTYSNIVYSYGLKQFSDDFGFLLDGLIIADLPNRMHDFFYQKGLSVEIIPFLTPTSRKEDILSINNLKGDFVYYVGTKGTTGVMGDLNFNENKISDIKKLVNKKVVYGFGIKTRDDIYDILKFSDGVVVGTEIVKRQKDFEKFKSFIKNTF
ncbi:tryptophan synthase, alpha subunit [Deferribacter desulfuricans SSM1]|uniref:tryptophan synthase n=1 Tax=Deferribacter desulfuricans (strain DSM 14783 / JCM 11476 / NBRC 101012 / SSM1) TaxID=639282 RepID=D3PBG5_DEFDS|nr:tryptophan synthase subunit alpha [Deferribacter desulfuricans]BAI79938.1 tryptophan synthase, alpha subunit [Deferribacter desulfuricans SSM1]